MTRGLIPAGVALALVMVAQVARGQGLGMSRTKTIDFNDRVVTFTTPDGVTIEADYYPVKVAPSKKTPVAVLIHMYPADRSSWRPFVPLLREAGIAALAYDIRGKGGSIKPAERKLQEGYNNPNSGHFKDAWKDLQGAHMWLNQQANINTRRMVLIGASIGCSISLEYASRHPKIKGVVCLSPGTNYFGVDSIEHIKKCSTIPILLMSPEKEYEAVRKLVEASGGKAKSRKYPGGREYHGTGMFKADYGKKVQKRIVKFVKKSLGIKSKKKSEKAEKKNKKKRKKTPPNV